MAFHDRQGRREYAPIPWPEEQLPPARPSPGKVTLTSRLAPSRPGAGSVQGMPGPAEPSSATKAGQARPGSEPGNTWEQAAFRPDLGREVRGHGALPDSELGALGPGRPLDSSLGSLIGGMYGRDFSGVRVHADPMAGLLARQHNARAFTMGSQIVFGAGMYRPRTPEGDALIAHELAHVAQQRGGHQTIQRKPMGAASSSALEADADRAAVGVLARLYGGGKSVLRRLAANAGPALTAPTSMQRCDESAASRARARLEELEGLSEDEFRAEVGAMSSDDTRELLDNVSPEDEAANQDLLKRIRTERLVSTAESLVGDLYWAGGSGPDASLQIRTTTTRPSDFADPTQSETNNNDFAAWVRRGGQPPEPDENSKMNCWEAVIFSGYRAGVIPFSWIADVHQRAATAGQDAAANVTSQEVEQQTRQRWELWKQDLLTRIPLAEQALQQDQALLQQLQDELQQLQGQSGQLSPQDQQRVQDLTQEIPVVDQRVQAIQQELQDMRDSVDTLDLLLDLPNIRARIQQLQQQLQGGSDPQLQQELQQLEQTLQALEPLEQRQQEETRFAIGADAYYGVLGDALGVNGAAAVDASTQVPRGDLVFFNGLAHVALSAGYNNSENELISLWLAPLSGQAYYNHMQRTTITEVVDAMQNDLGMQNVQVTHATNPW